MNTNEEIDGERTMDAAKWLNECLRAEKKLRDALKKVDEWKARYADVIERLEGKLHCVEECKCSNRLEIRMMRKILQEDITTV